MVDLRLIISQIKSGETAPYKEIVVAYAAPIRAYFASRLSAKDMVEDLVQDTFIAAFENINSYDEERSFLQWLMGIASNKLKMHYRSKKIQKSVYAKFVDTIRNQKAEITEGAEELLLKSKKLHGCIELLPLKMQELLKARYFQNMQVKQLAELQNTTELAISSNLFRSRQKLAECLERGI